MLEDNTPNVIQFVFLTFASDKLIANVFPVNINNSQH